MSECRKYQHLECEHTFGDAEGDPDSGTPSGARWEDIPGDWACPTCGAPKTIFRLKE